MRWNGPGVNLALLFIFIATFIYGRQHDDDLLITLALVGMGLNAVAWVRWLIGK